MVQAKGQNSAWGKYAVQKCLATRFSIKQISHSQKNQLFILARGLAQFTPKTNLIVLEPK